jgi:histone acetyltransferase (RNA polymerase elongator complex component)
MKTYHIPIFVPHKGCPHDCVFCNQRHITGQISDTTPEDVVRIIEENLATVDKDSYVEVAFFGGSFTAIEPHMQEALLKAAYPYVKDKRVDGIRCSTRPDSITKEILETYKSYGGTSIELGVQSTDKEVLLKSHRGHTYEDVVNASWLIKDYGIELGVQMMLGLPGDTREKMINTAKDLISLSPKCVRLYPTLVVEDTALWNMFQKGSYKPLDTEEAVDILAELIPMFVKNGVDVIRVGLQTTDEINEATVKGPYHPAIRELAEGRIIRNLIENNLQNGTLEVFAAPSMISRVSGHKRCNKDYFKRKYNVELKVTALEGLGENELKICDKFVAIY